MPALPPPHVAWFARTTQTLMDALAPGNRAPWARVLAPDCIITDEDGGVSTRSQFLASLHPLPRGFSGRIRVYGLTVLRAGDAAVVHYWLDERENVFSDRLRTRYVNTDTYRRTSGGWQIVAMQTTVVPRDLAPLTSSTRSWPDLIGEYAYSPNATVYRVFERAGRLYFGSSAATATELIPLTERAFFEKGSIHTLIFTTGADGRATAAVEIHKYNEVVMKRLR